jgi:hypothetical protein
VLGPSQKRKRNAGVKLTEEGNIDDASARWRPTEEAASVDGGGPDGARQLQGGGGVRGHSSCHNPKREALRGDAHHEGEEGSGTQQLPIGEASDGVGVRMWRTAVAPHGGKL